MIRDRPTLHGYRKLLSKMAISLGLVIGYKIGDFCETATTLKSLYNVVYCVQTFVVCL